MATGILSEGIEFYYNPADATATLPASGWVQVTDLQEIPDLGGTPDNVEVTTLDDASRRYIAGLKDYGDLSFTFLYDNSSAASNYRVLKGFEGAVKWYQIELPDGTKFSFKAEVTTIVAGAGVNAALTFTANLALNSDITVTDPA